LNPFERMKKKRPSAPENVVEMADLSETPSTSNPPNLPQNPEPTLYGPEPPPELSHESSADIESMVKKFSELLQTSSNETLEKIDCEVIAEKIYQKMKSLDVDAEEDIHELESCFAETDDEKYCCMVCHRHISSPVFPENMKKGVRGNHGIFNKPNAPSYKTNKERKKRMHDHCRTDVHLWCVNQEKIMEEQNDVEREKSDRCAEILVTSAIQCFKDLDGSMKFVRNNNMLETLLPSDFPTKNDGRQMYFKIREMFFERLTNAVKKKFKDVKNACFTLDKVTVRRTPFTVIMTYFFSEGRIHVLLNSVHKMKVDEYSGCGSAEMVGSVLMSSLGLSKEEVADKFRHGTYDGVYATTEERVAGGGSLSLMHHFAAWCDIPKEQFTGHWDVGHKLQLVYGTALKKNKEVSSFLSTMEKIMQMCQGKEGLLFHQVASELKAAVLTDKSEQTTRWVRSLLRLILAYYRNMPVLHAILSKAIDEARTAGDLTEQKTLQKKLDSFCNPRHVGFGIGLAQILDSYAQVSMNAQQLWNFPGTLCILMQQLSEELNNSATLFVWKDTDLVITGLGNPSLHISNLERGLYKTHLSETVKTSAANRLNLAQMDDFKDNLVEKGISGGLADEPTTVFVTSDDIQELEFSLPRLEEGDKQHLVSSLQKVCQDLTKSLKERFQVAPLFKDSVDMFHLTDWFKNQEEDKLKELEKMQALVPKLSNPSLETKVAENIEDVVATFHSYLQYKEKNIEKSAEKLYKDFYESHFDKETPLFFELFEFINIKSYSEAYCESVGSLMNICVDKGRNMAPANFSKELILAFNSPPLHIMRKMLIPQVIADLQKEVPMFSRKLEKSRKASMLNFTTSASIGNFRKRAEQASHVPPGFFT
jgi:hypothetical protein